MARRTRFQGEDIPLGWEEVPHDVQMEQADAQEHEEQGPMRLMPSAQVTVKDSVARAAKQIIDTDEEKVHNWVRGFCRLAIFSEQRRAIIRREDLTKKIFESDKTAVRIFPALFKHTQRQLRKIFAMELVPLRPRGQENDALTQQKLEIQASQGGETMAATQRKDPPSPDTAKAWVVRSVLPPELHKEMISSARRIAREVGPDSAEAKALSQFRPADEDGVVVDWQRNDSQLGSMGLLYLILGLILVSGRELPDAKLRAYLARLGLTTSSILPRALRPDDTYPPGKPDTEQASLPARQTETSPHTVNDWLEVLTKHQYLEVDNKTATITGQRQRRTHVSRRNKNREATQDDEGEDIVWKWGGRAEAEVGEEAAAQFIVEIMEAGRETTELNPEEPLAPGQRGRRDNRGSQGVPAQSLHDTLMISVERAVGSQFVS